MSTAEDECCATLKEMHEQIVTLRNTILEERRKTWTMYDANLLSDRDLANRLDRIILMVAGNGLKG